MGELESRRMALRAIVILAGVSEHRRRHVLFWLISDPVNSRFYLFCCFIPLTVNTPCYRANVVVALTRVSDSAARVGALY